MIHLIYQEEKMYLIIYIHMQKNIKCINPKLKNRYSIKREVYQLIILQIIAPIAIINTITE